jgi:hypothetical protein
MYMKKYIEETITSINSHDSKKTFITEIEPIVQLQDK